MAIARGKDKEPLARKLGAIHYIDSQVADPAAELNKLGGAKVVIATVTNAAAMTADTWRTSRQRSAHRDRRGWSAFRRFDFTYRRPALGQRMVLSGTAIDSQDTLRFSASAGVQSMNEIFPLEASGRGLRSHDERKGTFSRRTKNGRIKPPTAILFSVIRLAW